MLPYASVSSDNKTSVDQTTLDNKNLNSAERNFQSRVMNVGEFSVKNISKVPSKYVSYAREKPVAAFVGMGAGAVGILGSSVKYINKSAPLPAPWEGITNALIVMNTLGFLANSAVAAANYLHPRSAQNDVENSSVVDKSL